jgi:hypothetical protein
MQLRKLERRAYSRQEKEAVVRALEDNRHNYTSFFVCRDPVEKFLSVYKYLMDARVSRPRYAFTFVTFRLSTDFYTPGAAQPPGHGGEEPGGLPGEEGADLAGLPAQAGQQPGEELPRPDAAGPRPVPPLQPSLQGRHTHGVLRQGLWVSAPHRTATPPPGWCCKRPAWTASHRLTSTRTATTGSTGCSSPGSSGHTNNHYGTNQ